VFVVFTDPSSKDEAVSVLYGIRRAGIAADMDYTGKSFKAQFKAAGGSGALYACVIGPEEISSGRATIKDLVSGEQETVSRDVLTVFLEARLR
jgi:histidyl-tRNA synthetase